MISLSDVTKSYDDTVVVDGVGLDLEKGGVTALVGPNGAGKSTLLSCIARLLAPDAGRVTIDGLDVFTTRSDEVARRLAILRQDNHLAVRLSVRDLVAFGRYPHQRGRGRRVGGFRPDPQDVAQIDRAIALLELEELEHRYLDELSGGQRQRAFVAMVLAQDTEYVLLDEPLNNLDLRHSAQMMHLLRRAADELGKTVLVVVHDINAASVVADEIVALREGRVMAHGTPEEIMRPDLLEEIFEVPVSVHEVDGQRIALHFTRACGLPGVAQVRTESA